MIEINCDTSKEAAIVNTFIRNGILSSSDELIKEAWTVVGKKLNLTYNIKENKNKAALTDTLKINEYDNIVESKVGEQNDGA